ncbi:MAG: MFS transporter [Myxococcota bacterium]|nr:MFS transporter [Myxococcota bacterium]
MSEAPAAAAPSGRYSRYVLLLIVLVMLLNTVDRHIVAILVDDIKRDLSLSDRQLGWILGPSFTLVYAISVFPLARWADRGVRRSIIALGLALWSVFTVLTAGVQSFGQMFAMRMGVGVGEASASPAAQSLISDTVPTEQRGRGLSMLSLGAVLGLAVGMAGGGWINELWGWRVAFVIAGVPGFVLALVFRLTIREPARGAIEGRDAAREKSGSWLEDCRYLLSLPSMRWLLVAHALALLYTTGKGAWEPTFIRRVYEMGSAEAGTWYFLTSPLPGALGIFLGGWLCDRWSRRDQRAHLWVPVLSTLGASPFLLAFLLWPEQHRIALPLGLPPMPVAFLFSIAGSVVGAMHSAPFLAAVQGLARLRMRASAAALFSLTGSGIGSGIGPLIIGDLNMRFAAAYGDQAVRWSLVWLTLAFVLTAVACVLAARSFRQDLARARVQTPVGPDPATG